MNPLTLEWVQKAEADHEAARLLSKSAAGLHDAVCFHAQQCIEKYFKAWPQESGIAFRRTHDLEELLDMIIATRPAWDKWRSDFIVLSTHAVESRYPGKTATTHDADHALHVCVDVRSTLRSALGVVP